jgi:hypothetical protein
MQDNLNQPQKIPVKIDNSETLQVLEKLENLEDQDVAIRYLKKLNDKTSALGKYVMNRDHSVDHGTWKLRCDELQKDVDKLVSEIMSF